MGVCDTKMKAVLYFLLLSIVDPFMMGRNGTMQDDLCFIRRRDCG